jgi:hypothetical protein
VLCYSGNQFDIQSFLRLHGLFFLRLPPSTGLIVANDGKAAYYRNLVFLR